MKTISKEQWQKIQTIARTARERADKHNKPSTHLSGVYSRSFIQARQLGYGGDEEEWRRLVRSILD